VSAGLSGCSNILGINDLYARDDAFNKISSLMNAT